MKTNDLKMICLLPFFFALVVLAIIPATSSEENTISYWTNEGNKYYINNETRKAEECYDYAIFLDSIKQPNAPAIGEINFGSIVYYWNNSTKIIIGPITFDFDLINPNNLDMRINNIYIENSYFEGERPENATIISLLTMGPKKNINYCCDLIPINGTHKCEPLERDFDYIKISSKELEHFVIGINSSTPGIYMVNLIVEYSFASETKRIAIAKDIFILFEDHQIKTQKIHINEVRAAKRPFLNFEIYKLRRYY